MLLNLAGERLELRLPKPEMENGTLLFAVGKEKLEWARARGGNVELSSRFDGSCRRVSFSAAEDACREAGSALPGARGVKTQCSGFFPCAALVPNRFRMGQFAVGDSNLPLLRNAPFSSSPCLVSPGPVTEARSSLLIFVLPLSQHGGCACREGWIWD